MDKQQIEEMANFFKSILPIKAMADWIPIKIIHNYKGYAEELYNAGYRKIPKNAVVLVDEKDIQQYEWSKLIDKMGVIKFGEKLRKETAEKFAERAKEEAFVMFMGEPIIRASKIDEICKEFTEGN